MRKSILVAFTIISLLSVGTSGAIVWDLEKLMTGRQMVPYGAGWYADDQVMYFGTDKDGYIKYDGTTDTDLEFTCTGGIAFENAVVFDGTVGLSGDLTMAAGKNVSYASGAGSFDASSATGTFATSTGANSLNGDVTIASGKDFAMTGTGTFGTGTGAVSLNGDITVADGKDYAMTGAGTFGTGTGAVSINGDATVAAGKDLDCASGASEFDWSLGTGIFKTTTGLHTFGGGLASNWDMGDYEITVDDVNVDNDTAITGALDVDGATTLDAVAIAETLDVDGNTDLDLLNVSETLDVDGATTLDGLTVAEAATFSSTIDVDGNSDLDLVNISETLDVDGATTLDGLTVAEAASFEAGVTFGDYVKYGVTSSAANITIGDTGNDIYLVGNASGHQYVTLPTASANTGRVITISIATAPGDNNVIVDGEGDETINGAATLTNTANVGECIQIICGDTGWYTISMHGTWS